MNQHKGNGIPNARHTEKTGLLALSEIRDREAWAVVLIVVFGAIAGVIMVGVFMRMKEPHRGLRFLPRGQ